MKKVLQSSGKARVSEPDRTRKISQFISYQNTLPAIRKIKRVYRTHDHYEMLQHDKISRRGKVIAKNTKTK